MIVIIGAGICGLSIGWRLADAGGAVTIVDRGKAGRGATWAAAGMLAPQVEAEPGEEALLPLLLESRAMWAGFARELERRTGIPVGYRTEGTMVVALDRDDREAIEHRFGYLTGLGLSLKHLTGGEARRREPRLSPAVTGAIFSPFDHQVDNRAVAKALRAAAMDAGAALIEETEVAEILVRGARAVGVRLPDRDVAADTVVLAAGAWSRNISGLPDAVRPPVRPVKGQMLAVRTTPGAPLIDHVVWSPRIYLVPRRDGRLLIGATVEETGFDTRMTAGGVFDLLRHAREVLPGLDDLPLVETWAGLRPTSRDDAPILGPTELDGLVMATGHHRNGILLAPITARAIGDLILTGAWPETLRPFELDRFAPGTATAEAK